jgi:hypothetical protein
MQQYKHPSKFMPFPTQSVISHQKACDTSLFILIRHYYAAVLTTANGTLEFAKNGDDGETEIGGRMLKRKPRALPLIPPRTLAHTERPANPCTNPFCRSRCSDALNPVRHGEFCNGTWLLLICFQLGSYIHEFTFH